MNKMLIHTPAISGRGMYECFKYPAGELQVRLTNKVLIEYLKASYDRPKIVATIKSSDDIMEFALLFDALARTGRSLPEVVLPYMPYARADRQFCEGDCVGSQTFKAIIDGMEVSALSTLDVHSTHGHPFCLANVSPLPFIHSAIGHFATINDAEEIIVLYPDKGARDRYPADLGVACNVAGIKVQVFNCEKARDPSTGKLSGFAVPDLPYMPILIVDDLCDGGGTFLGIANQAEGTVPLGLYITHGIFSKGFGELGSTSVRSTRPTLTTNVTRTRHRRWSRCMIACRNC